MLDIGTFRRDLAKLINRHSKENGSETPDFILATYLKECLEAFDKAVVTREQWYDEQGKVWFGRERP
jgi:hypothetical protein